MSDNTKIRELIEKILEQSGHCVVSDWRFNNHKNILKLQSLINQVLALLSEPSIDEPKCETCGGKGKIYSSGLYGKSHGWIETSCPICTGQKEEEFEKWWDEYNYWAELREEGAVKEATKDAWDVATKLQSDLIDRLTAENKDKAEANSYQYEQIVKLQANLAAAETEIKRLNDYCIELQGRIAAANEENKRLTTENDDFLKMTEELDEHPEGYDGPCWCKLCKSYG